MASPQKHGKKKVLKANAGFALASTDLPLEYASSYYEIRIVS